MPYSSLEKFAEAGRKGIAAEPEDLFLVFHKPGLNLLIFSDPKIKTHLLSNLVANELSKGVVVIYIDLDTKLTGYLGMGVAGFEKPENLVVYLPRGGDMDEIISEVCSPVRGSLGAVILDSISTLYLVERGKFSELNRKVGIYLSLLKAFAKRANIPVIITSMYKMKKISSYGKVAWVRSPAGGRILTHSSNCVLEVSGDGSIVRVKAIKHKVEEIVGLELALALKPL